jgi:hypothetical protein
VHNHSEQVRVCGLVIPPLLNRLMREGRWQHPGDAAIKRVMPWFEDPLHFLDSVQAMERESRSLFFLTDDEASARLFRQARGAGRISRIDLPWLDVDQAFLIAVNQHPGDDVAIALDYRTDSTDPRVVASDFWTEPGICSWREVTPAFSALVDAFDL